MGWRGIAAERDKLGLKIRCFAAGRDVTTLLKRVPPVKSYKRVNCFSRRVSYGETKFAVAKLDHEINIVGIVRTFRELPTFASRTTISNNRNVSKPNEGWWAELCHIRLIFPLIETAVKRSKLCTVLYWIHICTGHEWRTMTWIERYWKTHSVA